YGIADLKGQNLRTRVKELVRIAHPDFRDWLEFEARKMNFIP
ncbi:MAG: Acetyl-CoA hydrolase/transferase C-terminal domain, partial [Firmicutes bacterium]|nr:Acetyl-CoA hydrolase/transferase C-terminal domain [Bacillota bacterium]